jgi:hypothetical protein
MTNMEYLMIVYVKVQGGLQDTTRTSKSDSVCERYDSQQIHCVIHAADQRYDIWVG